MFWTEKSYVNVTERDIRLLNRIEEFIFKRLISACDSGEQLCDECGMHGIGKRVENPVIKRLIFSSFHSLAPYATAFSIIAPGVSAALPCHVTRSDIHEPQFQLQHLQTFNNHELRLFIHGRFFSNKQNTYLHVRKRMDWPHPSPIIESPQTQDILSLVAKRLDAIFHLDPNESIQILKLLAKKNFRDLSLLHALCLTIEKHQHSLKTNEKTRTIISLASFPSSSPILCKTILSLLNQLQTDHALLDKRDIVRLCGAIGKSRSALNSLNASFFSYLNQAIEQCDWNDNPTGVIHTDELQVMLFCFSQVHCDEAMAVMRLLQYLMDQSLQVGAVELRHLLHFFYSLRLWKRRRAERRVERGRAKGEGRESKEERRETKEEEGETMEGRGVTGEKERGDLDNSLDRTESLLVEYICDHARRRVRLVGSKISTGQLLNVAFETLRAIEEAIEDSNVVDDYGLIYEWLLNGVKMRKEKGMRTNEFEESMLKKVREYEVYVAGEVKKMRDMKKIETENQDQSDES